MKVKMYNKYNDNESTIITEEAFKQKLCGYGYSIIMIKNILNNLESGMEFETEFKIFTKF